MRLILFDIDGTLIQSHGAGREAIMLALHELFGTTGPVDSYRMDGKTDHRIVTDLLTAANIPAAEVEEKLPAIFQAMAEHGRNIFPQRGMTPCPGIPQLLEALHNLPNVILGLLTGNSSQTAPLKLAAAGINPDFFQIGAFGSDHVDRNALPFIAKKRAFQLTGQQFDGYNMLVVGDTPADILCARAGTATAVAVATGRYSVEQLQQYQPDFIFDNLTDTAAFLQLVKQ